MVQSTYTSTKCVIEPGHELVVMVPGPPSVIHSVSFTSFKPFRIQREGHAPCRNVLHHEIHELGETSFFTLGSEDPMSNLDGQDVMVQMRGEGEIKAGWVVEHRNQTSPYIPKPSPNPESPTTASDEPTEEERVPSESRASKPLLDLDTF